MPDLREAMQLDVRYINPFMESVTHLFRTMLSTELTLSKPKLSTDDVHADASAVIGFSGDATGCMVLCFPMHTAVKAASIFAGIEMTKDHEDFGDALVVKKQEARVPQPATAGASVG